jgi:chromosome partitioning protein
MPVVAIVNQKGGVGKTTIALGLASAAARRGARVLVVDLDPQANATSGLGVWDSPTTVDDALAADRPGGAPALAVPSAWPAVGGGTVPDVVASTPALAAREPQLANDPVGAQDRLQLALEGHGYDLVLIDCPPSLGLLTVNGLFAADRALIVTEPAAWASDGVAQIRRTVSRIAARRDGQPAIAGVAVNRLGRTRDARYWHEQLIEQYGDAVLAPVHLRAAVTEASAQSLPVHALGTRAGAREAAAELDALLAAVVPELAQAPAEESAPVAPATDVSVPAAPVVDASVPGALDADEPAAAVASLGDDPAVTPAPRSDVPPEVVAPAASPSVSPPSVEPGAWSDRATPGSGSGEPSAPFGSGFVAPFTAPAPAASPSPTLP